MSAHVVTKLLGEPKSELNEGGRNEGSKNLTVYENLKVWIKLA